MTTAITSITVTLLDGNLCSDSTPTRAAVERLAQETADALADAFPGAEVQVPVQWGTSGAGPGPHIACADPLEEASDRDRERVESIASATWERWVRALSDSDVQS